MLDTMETLCCLDGVSGAENEIRDYILERTMSTADELFTDSMGNIILLKKGARKLDQKILLCAHMDEVGLIVTGISADGCLHFDSVGGIDRRVLIGKKVFVGADRIPGFIGIKAFHLSSAEQRKKLPDISSLYIDIGVNSKESAELLVSPGDCVAFDDSLVRFGEGYIKAKAIDDRCGCAVMLELLEKELPCDCWFAFTVQEEVGCRGASVAANRIAPDIAIILEGTTAGDLPDVVGPARTCELGRGVVIPFMDGSTVYDKELYKKIVDIAETKHIPWQTKTRIAGGTDASVIQRSGKGCRVAAISVPVRNLHSPACIAKVSECEDQLRLTEALLEALAQ